MRAIAIAAAVLLVPSAAFAQESDTKPGAELKPWQVDVRASLHTTPVLQYGGIGASADAGIARLGPGTLAAGGGIAYDTCAVQCISVPYEKTQNHFWGEGRLSYHLSTNRLPNVDLYPVATAGFVLARSSITVGDAQYRASQLAPTIAFGVGASWFLTKRFYVSGEARLRFASGDYGYELESGHAQAFDRSKVDSWQATTIDIGLAAGARF